MSILGPYEVQYRGQRYFGNVRLVEHRIFESHGALYLFNVASHTACAISERVAAACAEVDRSYGELVPEGTISELTGLSLIAGTDGDHTAATETAAERDSDPVVNIALFLAQQCNMRCVYCYGNGGTYGRQGLMSWETACQAVDWLMTHSGTAEKVTISFFGGEPLLNVRVLRRVLPYAREQAALREKHISFTVTTNGSLLDEETIAFLSRERIKVVVSLDGPPEYQDRQRPFANGKGSHEKVVENVRRLQAAVPRVAARATLWREADPLRIMAALEHTGFNTYSIVKASPSLQGGDPSANGGEPGRILEYYRAAAERLLALIRLRRIDQEPVPDLLRPLIDLDRGRRRHYGCGVGKNLVAIDVMGDIYPCHRFVGSTDLCLGSVKAPTVTPRAPYWNACVDALRDCRGCWARYLCGGGCLYDNKAHTGDMHVPDRSYCAETQALFEELVYVYCELNDHDREFLRRWASEHAENGAPVASAPTSRGAN
jgi:uncharacterized protein